MPICTLNTTLSVVICFLGLGIFTFSSFTEIDKLAIDNLKMKMKEKGFKGAFVVAFLKGKRISTKEALSLQSKNKSHE